MATTNFGALSAAQKRVWSRDVWKMARNLSFVNQFAGKGSNAMVTRVTELSKTERGDRAVVQLIADLEGDGVAGDNTLEGKEEAIQNFAQEIVIDQLRHANRTKGKMADQRTVINFREQSKDVLAYWLADRIDQMAFLSLAGITYNWKNSNVTTARTASELPSLAFASSVTTPTTGRHFNWDADTGTLVTGNTATIDDPTAVCTPSYATIVALKAKAQEQYMRGIRGAGNQETFHWFLSPGAMAKLKMDSDFIANIRNAGVRGGKNPLFSGADSYMVDGVWVHSHRHVPVSSAWGTGNDPGCATLFCGAQALALADICAPEWNEETFDYGNQRGIEVGKIFGLLKPQFHSIYSGQVEDFGVIRVNVQTSADVA